MTGNQSGQALALTFATVALFCSGARAADRDRVEDVDYNRKVAIVFDGTSATVSNSAGVTVTQGANGSSIAITSTQEGVEYILSGAAVDGYFQLTSTHDAKITLNGVSLSSSNGPAVSVTSTARTFIALPDGKTNILNDGATYTRPGSGTLHSAGPLLFSGKGALSVSSTAAHAINSNTYVRCFDGEITVPTAGKDAIHTKVLFEMEAGSLKLNPSGDGIDGGAGSVLINGGSVAVRGAADGMRGLVADGTLTVNGGSVNVTLTGAKTRGLSSDGALTINGGAVAVHLSGNVVLESATNATTGTTYTDPSAAAGLKSDAGIAINGGAVSILHTGVAGRGLNAEGDIRVSGGTLDVLATGGPSVSFTDAAGSTGEAAARALKSDGAVVFSGGEVTVRVDGIAAHAVSSDTSVTLGAGSRDIVCTGARSKGINANTGVTISGGATTMTLSGALVLQSTATANRFDPAYCTAIKSDTNLTMSAGSMAITHSGQAGKGISADGNITITGGTLAIATSGAASSVFTNTTGTSDVAAADCLKADGTLTISGGTITASATGSAADAISCGGAAIIGVLGNDTSPVITASTSGARVVISGSGMNVNASNAKAFKAGGNLTMNGGIYRGSTASDGGEGMESKANLVINGGVIEINSYDDGINAATSVTINGGRIYCYASNNDGIDSNGTIRINGGVIVSSGSNSPEEGFDCDNNNFTITGGIMVGTGGATSTPTAGTSTQRSVIYKAAGTANVMLHVSSSSGSNMVYKIPRTYSGGGGGGGSSTPMTLLFSNSGLVSGTTYTITSGATVSGGTEFHGLYTGATVTGGTTLKTFTPTNMVTTVQ